jgi:hypothetical protein
MMPIHCTRCRRQFFSAARPRPGQRCPICQGSLEVGEDGTASAYATPLGLPPIARADAGSFDEGEDSYRSLLDFAGADPRRGPSPERDLGLRWRDTEDRVYRAAWAAKTHELILIQLGPEESGGGHVEVLAVADERLVVDALDGWESVCGLAESAEWLRDRVAVLPGSGASRVGAAA